MAKNYKSPFYDESRLKDIHNRAGLSMPDDPASYFYELGQAKRKREEEEKRRKEEEKRRKEEEKLLEQAAKEAALKEAEAKRLGLDPDRKFQKDIENSEFRIESVGEESDPDDRNWFEKLTNLPKDQNWLFDAIDLMQRPVNAVMNVAKEGAKADYKKPTSEENIKHNEENGMSWGDIGSAFWDGLSGKEKSFGSDFLEAKGVENKYAKGLGGFALDVLADPLSLLPVGMIAKGAKGVTKATKLDEAVKKARDTKAGEFIEDRVVDPLGAVFNPKHKMTETLEGGQSDFLLNLRDNMRDLGRYQKDNILDNVANISRNTGGGLKAGNQVAREMEATNGLNNIVNTLSPEELMRRISPQSINDLRPTKPFDNYTEITSSTRPRYKYNNKTGQLEPSSNPFDVKMSIGSSIVRHIDSPSSAVKELSSNPNIQQSAQELVQSNREIRELAESFGISVADLPGYLAHVLTDEAKRVLGRKGGTGLSRIGGNSNVLTRNLEGSIEEINKRMKKKLGVDEFFNPNAFFSTAVGQQRLVNFITAEHTKRAILDNSNFAVKYTRGDAVPKNAVKINVEDYPFFKNNLGQMENATSLTGEYVVTKAAKRVLDNYKNKISDDGINAVVKSIESLTHFWKKNALFSVGFHVRNHVGNNFNMWLNGMRPDQLTTYGSAAGKAVKAAKKAREGKTLSKAEREILDYYDEFARNGLKSSSIFDSDLAARGEKAINKELKYRSSGTLGKVVEGVKNPFFGSRKIGENIDEMNRLSLYMWARKSKNMNPKEAASEVRKVLFDYDELTDAERYMFRAVFPFYTWMKNNAVYQMKSFIHDPKKYSDLDKLLNTGYEVSEINPDETANWKKEAMLLPFMGDGEGNGRMLNLGLPASDLIRNSPENILSTLVNSGNPLAKLPVELVQNKDLFLGRDIENFEGERASINVPFTENDIETSPKMKYAIEQMLPTLKRAEANNEKLTSGDFSSLGGISREHNRVSDINQIDYEEKERLQDLIKRIEQDTGKEVPTVTELKKAGFSKDESIQQFQLKLKKQGYQSSQIKFLTGLKEKVAKNNAEYALKVRSALQSKGVPEDIILEVTKDYLDYNVDDFIQPE